jgi:uncharacterized protein (DUF111 family)
MRLSAFPATTFEKSGYGAGTRDFPGQPNVVRLTIGEAVSQGTWFPPFENREGWGSQLAGKTTQETIAILEANLDDLNPQVFGYVMDRLLEDGALDVFGVPVQMKKNRPGTLLTVLCRPEDAARLTQLLFAETSTLGVRQRLEQRQTLARRWVTVATQWGDVRVKIASMNGTVSHYAPEYEDCRRIAREQRLPLKDVMQAATQAYLRASTAEKR